MRYTKITVDLIVLAETSEAVIADLNTTLDTLDEKHTVYGGNIETVAFEHAESPRRSALTHTVNAGETAIKAAKKGLTAALRAVI